ncbi:MAG: hypothetical protein LUE12_00070 [Ruminococcus sp.]|nr:hypothetical protein [Ruminococcus sp.]
MKKSAKIAIVSFIPLIALFLFVYFNVHYFSIHIKTNLSDDQFKKISDEFLIDTCKDNFVCLYYQGSDRFGVCVILTEFSADAVCNALNIDIDKDDLQNYLINNSYVEYENSKGISIKAKNISNFISQTNISDLKIYLYENDGKYYIELEKGYTDNISIFQYNIDFVASYTID